MQSDRQAASKIIRGVLAAIDELLTEFLRKKRAADWGIINDGLCNAERYLRESTKPTEAGGRRDGER